MKVDAWGVDKETLRLWAKPTKGGKQKPLSPEAWKKIRALLEAIVSNPKAIHNPRCPKYLTQGEQACVCGAEG